jgi:hypothetical protein
MSDISNDDSRLRATEAQMRRALGLDETAAAGPAPAAPHPVSAGPHRPARRLRDGEVTVSAIQRDDLSGTSPLEAARQATRAQAAAREQAEQRLANAQDAIQDLQTKLGHERLAKEEMVERAAVEQQAKEQALASLQAELLAARAVWRQTEEQLKAALARCQALEQRLQDRRPVRQAEETTQAPPSTAQQQRKPHGAAPVGAENAVGAEPDAPVRRRGRPRKVHQPEPGSAIVEWWKPGWRDRYR